MAINLLPEELKPKSTTLKASKKMRKASILMLTVFVISGLVVGGIVLVFANLISLTNKRKADLESQIVTLKQTETRLVLLKDRVQKIGNLEKDDILSSKIDVLKGVIESTEGLIAVDTIKVDKDGIAFTVKFANSLQLGNFLATLKDNSEISNLRLDNVKYFLDTGYEITVTI